MRSARFAFVLALVCLSLGATARAADDKKCPKWFPDFSCDRQARWEGFIAPMGMPFYFEDPFVTTGISTWGVWNQAPYGSALKGGDIYAVAAQLRVALTDNFGLIATQDGYAWMYPGQDSLVRSGNGWLNYMFGFKWAFWESKEKDTIMALSLRFKTSWGSASVLQQGGKGGVIPQISLAWGKDKWHVIGDGGGYMAIDGDQESSFAFYNLHVDYQIHKVVWPFVELNGISYMDGGNGSRQIKLKGGFSTSLQTAQTALHTGGFDGVDLANLGSRNIDGQTFLTAMIGLRCRMTKHSTIGIAYERPLTSDHEIVRQRGTLSIDFEL